MGAPVSSSSPQGMLSSLFAMAKRSPPSLSPFQEVNTSYARTRETEIAYAAGTARDKDVTLYLNFCLDTSSSMDLVCGNGLTGAAMPG